LVELQLSKLGGDLRLGFGKQGKLPLAGGIGSSFSMG
jgi:hypothetical protein